MKVANQKAMSLGYVEKHGVKKDGTAYDIYCLSYVVENEGDARKMYMESSDYSLLRAAKENGHWGDRFTFSGEVNGNGTVKLESIEKIEENE